MKYYLLIACLPVFGGLQAPSRGLIHWNFYAKKINTDSFHVHLNAVIAKGWHIYSINNETGPGPTSIVFDKDAGFRLRGDARESGKVRRVREPIFDAYVRVLFSKAEYTQLAERKEGKAIVLTGYIKYMLCNGSRCLPPEKQRFHILLR